MSRNGNITFVGITVMLLLSSLLILSLNKMNTINKEIANRSQTYLCFKYLVNVTDKYIENMGSLNTTIAIAYPLTFIPKTTVAARMAIKIAKTGQYTATLVYLNRIRSNRYCSLFQAASFAINIPHLVHKRNINETTKLRKRRWTVIVPSRLKKLKIILKGKYRLKNSYTRKAKLKTTETGMEDLQLWKLPFG